MVTLCSTYSLSRTYIVYLYIGGKTIQGSVDNTAISAKVGLIRSLCPDRTHAIDQTSTIDERSPARTYDYPGCKGRGQANAPARFDRAS